MGDVEDPPQKNQEATPLRPARNVLMRRSTRVFDREPKSGVLATTAALCCSLACSLIVIALFNVLSVVSIVIGAMYLKVDNCPAEPNIAPVLIASGILAILLSILEGRGRFNQARKEDSEGPVDSEVVQKDCCHWLMSFVRIAKLALFIYFCVIVYSLYSTVKYEPSTDPSQANLYCNANLYLFSFWTITFVLVSIGLALLACCCFCCCVALCVAADA